MSSSAGFTEPARSDLFYLKADEAIAEYGTLLDATPAEARPHDEESFQAWLAAWGAEPYGGLTAK